VKKFVEQGRWYRYIPVVAMSGGMVNKMRVLVLIGKLGKKPKKFKICFEVKLALLRLNRGGID